MKDKTLIKTSFVNKHKWFILKVILVIVCLFCLYPQHHYRIGLGAKKSGTVTVTTLKKSRGLGENAFEIALRGIGSTPDFKFEEVTLIFPLYSSLKRHYPKEEISIMWIESYFYPKPMIVEVEGEDVKIRYSLFSGIVRSFLFMGMMVCGVWVVVDLMRMKR